MGQFPAEFVQVLDAGHVGKVRLEAGDDAQRGKVAEAPHRSAPNSGNNQSGDRAMGRKD